MPSYRVVLTSSAERELKKLLADLVARIVPHLESLGTNPRPAGCRKLQGGDREWRLRVRDYRVVYTNTTKGRWSKSSASVTAARFTNDDGEGMGHPDHSSFDRRRNRAFPNTIGEI